MGKRIIFIIFITFILCKPFCFAGEINFEINLEKENISKGKQTELRALFNGRNDVPPPEMPFLNGLNFTYLKSEKKETLSGAGGPSVTHVYRVAVLKEGSFEIGPIIFDYKGDRYVSNMIKLNVEKEKIIPGQLPAVSEKLGDISNHIYLVLDIAKKNIYVNEEVPIKLMLFSDWLDVENISLQQKVSKDLIVRKFSDKIISNTVKDGVKYIVLEYKSSLVAVTAGMYTLSPIEATMEVVMSEEGTSAGQGQALLNDNRGFYEKFIGPSGRRTITVETQPVVFNASEVPAKEKPKKEEKLTIVPFKASYGPLGRYDMRFYRNKLLIPIAIIPVLAVLAASIIKRRLDMLAANPRYAAMLKASKKARARIKRCEELIKQGRQPEFYNTIFNIMQSYLGERAIIPEEGVTAKVLDKMEDFGLDRDLCEKIKKIFSDCYLVKYTPVGFDGNAMEKTLEEVKYVIDELDKK